MKVSKRTNAYTLETNGTAAHYGVYHGSGSVTACSVVPALNTSAQSTNEFAWLVATVAAGLTAGAASMCISNNNATAYLAISAEL